MKIKFLNLKKNVIKLHYIFFLTLFFIVFYCLNFILFFIVFYCLNCLNYLITTKIQFKTKHNYMQI